MNGLAGDVGMVSAVLLAVVLAWAGTAKLADRARVQRSFAALGLPSPSVLAIAVPAEELVLAVALLAVPAAGAVATIFTLAAFSAVLVSALRRGAAPPCACFGSATDRPLSTAALARNGLLAIAAAAAVLAGWSPHLPDAAGALVGGGAWLLGAGALRLSRDAASVNDG